MSLQIQAQDFGGLRGKLIENAALAPYTWLRVGGPADLLFLPKDEADLAMLLAQKPKDLPVFLLGAGSNILIRDGGIRGVVVRLTAAFANMSVEADNRIRVGAATPDRVLAKFAAKSAIDGFAFFSGIPGTIGGALRMNAGCYGSETADQLIEVVVLDEVGRRRIVGVDELNYAYRSCAAPANWIFVEALFQGRPGNVEQIQQQIQEIEFQREQSQPIREKTGGSTFKNPPGQKSWQLIDEAGGRGRVIGGAKMSDMHCNFMINQNHASAADLENLGESIRDLVLQTSGVELLWEIKRIGRS